MLNISTTCSTHSCRSCSPVPLTAATNCRTWRRLVGVLEILFQLLLFVVDAHMPLVTGGFPIEEAFTQLGVSLTRHMLTHDAVQACPQVITFSKRQLIIRKRSISQGKRAWMIFFAYICDIIPAEVMRRREHKTRLSNCQHLPFGRAPIRSKTLANIGVAQLTAVTTSQVILTAMRRSATSNVLHNDHTE